MLLTLGVQHQRTAITREAAATFAASLTVGNLSADTCLVHGAHGPVTQQPIGVRRLVDLHVPINHGSEPRFAKLARHSRAVLEGSSHPAPKTPTFSVFSALHDTILGEVSPVPRLCFPDLHDPQLLSSVQTSCESSLLGIWTIHQIIHQELL